MPRKSAACRLLICPCDSQVAAASLSSKAVYAPAGTCIASNSTVPASVRLYGDGDATVLKQKAGSSGALVTLGAGSQLASLQIDGNASAQTSANNGVAVTANLNLLQDVNIVNAKGDGVYFTNTNDVTFSTYTTLSNVRARGNRNAGFFINGAGNLKFENCQSTFNGLEEFGMVAILRLGVSLL